MRIELNPQEEALLASIEFEPQKMNPDCYQSNEDAAWLLAQSILGRNAVPHHRRRFFADPTYNAGGRNRSLQDLFRRSGNSTDEEIMRHPHFLEILRYFIFGPDLPQDAMAQFADEVKSVGQVTSGDVPKLQKAARRIVRDFGLGPADAGAFYQLALEMMGPFYARAIYDAIRKMK
jgi:hypothetical protein